MYCNIDIVRLLVLAMSVIIAASQVSANESRYSAVHNTNGTAMCALLGPMETSSVRSQLECSSRCKKNDKCTGFNYKKNAQQQQQQQQLLASVCETFSSTTSLGVVGNCAYFELQDTCATIAKNSLLKPAIGNPLLIQQNVDGSNFFNRTWEEFKCGFGSISGNYWLGNELLHQLTMNNTYKLRFELQSRDNQQWYWAEYSTFIVGCETTEYTLQVGGFSGNVYSDALDYHNGMKFTTKDRDNDMRSGGNCAHLNGGGFWYQNCALCNVNTVWGSTFDNYRWTYLTGSYWYLQTTRMCLVCR